MRNVDKVGGLLLVSGACSLVFQTAWFHEFRLIFGASTLASSAVLAVFMGGIGLGNAVLGKWVDRSDQPLRLYAKLEAIISFLCALTPFLVGGVRIAYVAIGGQESLGLIIASLVRLLGTIFVIGVPAFLMGGTLPAAVRAATQVGDVARHSVGKLYGLNTLGAVIGVLLGSFYLLETFGTRETLWLACVVNLGNATVAWFLSKRFSGQASASAHEPQGDFHDANSNFRKLRDGTASILPSSAMLYGVAGAIGAVFFMMELVWYRMLSPILGGSTYTFGLILAMALTGIGLGGAAYPLLFRRRLPTTELFSLVLALESLAIALPFAIGDRLAILALSLRDLSIFGFSGLFAGWVVITFIVIFPAAFVSGVQFPMLVAMIGRADKNVAKQLGFAFGWNTVGAMIGSIAGGFGLMTILTATGVWKLSVASLAVMAAVLWRWGSLRREPSNLLSTVAILIAAIGCLYSEGPTDVWRHGGIGAGRAAMPSTRNELIEWSNTIRRKIAWQVDGRESAVAIEKNDSLGFLVNGKSDGNAIRDAGTQIMLGVLPATLHPKPKATLVIGLGTGESAGWLASLPAVDKVDVVELEPCVVEMAELCKAFNHDVLRHPKVNLTFNDARELLQTTQMKYDVIVSEPSNPYRMGVSSLYTREFYMSTLQRLNEGGIFAQWLQGYEVSSSTVATVLKTLQWVYPSVEIWQTQPGDMVLVCSSLPLTYSIEALRERLLIPEISAATHVAWKTASVDGFLSHLMANEQYVSKVATQAHVDANTDNKNVLEYAFARTVGIPSVFDIERVQMQAIEMQLRWPARLDMSELVGRIRDHSIAADVIANRATIGSNDPPSRRSEVWKAIKEDRFSDAVAMWEQISESPHDYTEQLLIGMAYANARDSQLTEMLSQIERVSVADAAALETIYAYQVGDADRSARGLMKLFQTLRQTPIVTESLLLRCLLIAEELSVVSPQYSLNLLANLSEPFSLYQADLRRINAMILVASALGPREMSNAILPLEPYPIWSKEMLDWRLETYRALKLPIERDAAIDVSRFNRFSDRQMLIESAER